MSKTLTKRTTDYSDGKSFSFGFVCDCCNAEWVSPVLEFSGGECTDVKNETALNLLWTSEHRGAFERAILEAHLNFNNCPKCGKWVCDECFLADDMLCKNCKREKSISHSDTAAQSCC